MIRTLILTVWCLAILYLIRNEITCRHQIRRAREIHDYYAKNIKKFSPQNNLYDKMPEYNSQLYDLRIWTYRQFFPEVLE